MLMQYVASDINWVIGLGIMFGLAFLFTMLLEKDIQTFFCFAYIMNGLVVWGGLLDAWTLVLNTIFIIILLFLNLKNRGAT